MTDLEAVEAFDLGVLAFDVIDTSAARAVVDQVDEPADRRLVTLEVTFDRAAGSGPQRLGDGGFQEVSGLEVEMDVGEFAEGGRNDGMVRWVGRAKYQPIVCKRGMFAPSGGDAESAHEAIVRLVTSEGNTCWHGHRSRGRADAIPALAPMCRGTRRPTFDGHPQSS